jgi:hypothetical protein
VRRRCASYDLLAMLNEAGWRVFGADEIDRRLLERAGVPVPPRVPFSPDRSALRRPA